MGNSDFHFKQFSIAQDQTAMKVGTDGVLLGAWADISHAKRILDIGTGTGLIALMCAQRNTEADIYAIELDCASSEQAIDNIAQSKFRGRICVELVALQAFKPNKTFDAIICNPPFFKAGTRSPHKERQQARHGDSLSMDELLCFSSKLITELGELHLVLPIDRAGDLESSCAIHAWHVKRRVVVHPNPSRPPKRILISLSRIPQEMERTTLQIEHETRFDFTNEYIAITKPFYPKMLDD